MKRKKNFNLKKEKYSNLTKDSCVNNEITNKYIVTDEPNEGKRNNFEDIKKETIKTNNDKLFNEFSFEVDKKDKNSLKKLFKKAPNREKEEKKQIKYKKTNNKKRGQS